VNDPAARLARWWRPQPGWIALLAAVRLAAIGIQTIETVSEAFARRQTVWLGISLLVALGCFLPRPRQVALLSYGLFTVSLLLLIFVILPFVPRWLVPVRFGATRAIDLGVMAFQPSELAKITFVLAMAWYLRHRSSYRTLKGLLVPLGVMALPVSLILRQPDLGTAILFAPALAAMLLAAGAKLRHLGGLAGIALVLAGLNVVAVFALPPSLQPLRPHQQERIRAMVSLVMGDDRYVQSIGYQQHKAMTLVGAGGAQGYGDRAATVVRYNQLPHDHNDMIFVVLVSRWGLAGGLGVLGLYGALFGSMLWVAAATSDPFARLVTVGFVALLFTQMAINMAIPLGLIPVTGITLPLLSYGGSSLAVTLAMVGLVVNFGSRRPGILNWPSFEFSSE